MRVRLLGDGSILTGHVESLAAGIVDRKQGEGDNLLARVNPTFSRIRLAQCVPVRVAIDGAPEGVRLAQVGAGEAGPAARNAETSLQNGPATRR